MKIGLVGFPGSGKTTVFNALTGLAAGTGFHSARGKTNLGTVKVALLKSRWKPAREAETLRVAPCDSSQPSHIKEPYPNTHMDTFSYRSIILGEIWVNAAAFWRVSSFCGIVFSVTY